MNKISPKASLYGDIEIGDNVRIDDFCILTGKIRIGSNVHIAAYSFLSGSRGITLEDYVQIAPRTTILTASDDYSGLSMVGPMIPDKFKPALDCGPVVVGKHVLFGLGTVVMPFLKIGEGASTGAFTFVKMDLNPWSMYVGCPARYLRPRSMDMLKLAEKFERERRNDVRD